MDWDVPLLNLYLLIFVGDWLSPIRKSNTDCVMLCFRLEAFIVSDAA